MKPSILELERMARRGAEDGHDPAWHAQVTASPRLQSVLRRIHDMTLEKMKKDEDAFLAECEAKRRKQNETNQK